MMQSQEVVIMTRQANTRLQPDQAPIVGRGVLDVPGWEPLELGWSDLGLVWLSLIQGRRAWRGALGVGAGQVSVADVPKPYRDILLAYFAGEQVEVASVPVDMRGSPFQLRVWQALRSIGRGRVLAYREVAALVGSPRAMRAVGAANAANPLPVVVPCHRVIEAGCLLGGYSGGLGIKRRLLALEGVRLVGDSVLVDQLQLV
jgi:O-6-methylguanine DNA methyltransferase